MRLNRRLNSNKNTNPVCKRCGQCCYLIGIKDGKLVPTNEPCPHLVFNEDGTTSCDIYEERLGERIGGLNKCVEREKTPFDYYGCPFNSGEKPLVKNHKIIKKKNVYEEFFKGKQR